MFVAVEGCCHGELDKIYEVLSYTEQQNNIKVDLLLICGDFQAVRNKSDLNTMAVPLKYQKMNTFYKYGDIFNPCSVWNGNIRFNICERSNALAVEY